MSAIEIESASMYKIGDLAREAGVPVTTVRYYERAGLLQPTSRSRANYRLYETCELRRLQFIRAAQSAGFTLAAIKTLLTIREAEKPSCAKALPIIERQLVDIKRRIDDLKATCAVLEDLRTKCIEAAADDDACPAITALDK